MEVTQAFEWAPQEGKNQTSFVLKKIYQIYEEKLRAEEVLCEQS